MNKCLFTLFVENGKRFYFSPSCTSFIQVKMFSSSVHTDSHQLLSKKKKVKKVIFSTEKVGGCLLLQLKNLRGAVRRLFLYTLSQMCLCNAISRHIIIPAPHEHFWENSESKEERWTIEQLGHVPLFCTLPLSLHV